MRSDNKAAIYDCDHNTGEMSISLPYYKSEGKTSHYRFLENLVDISKQVPFFNRRAIENLLWQGGMTNVVIRETSASSDNCSDVMYFY